MARYKQHFLIAYDIKDPKRLAKVARILCNYATRIQYSVFHFYGPRNVLDECLRQIRLCIINSQDDIRCYGIKPIDQAIIMSAALGRRARRH